MLLALLAACGVGVAAALATLTLLERPGAEPPSSPQPRLEPASPVQPPDPRPTPPSYEVGRSMVPPQPGVRPALRPPSAAELAARFAGTGRIEGSLDLPEGVAAPQRWTLVLEPSRVLIGGEHARPRRVAFEQGERSFELTDVPLGGYELRAEAPGMSGATDYLLLARPDSQHVVVRLGLRPSAYVEGLVRDEDGAPVDGLRVLLEPASGGPPLEVTTGPGGAYLFERVPDGEYRLVAGDLHNPLVEPRELAVSAPSLHMPALVLPVLGSIEVQVVDDAGLLVAGARVEGWGSRGGRLALTTDASGTARARFLPAGRYTLSAWSPDHATLGRARARLELKRGAAERVELALQP